jgi:hypothetical protein
MDRRRAVVRESAEVDSSPEGGHVVMGTKSECDVKLDGF